MALADGSVRFIAYTVEATTFADLAQRNDNHPVNLPYRGKEYQHHEKPWSVLVCVDSGRRLCCDARLRSPNSA